MLLKIRGEWLSALELGTSRFLIIVGSCIFRARKISNNIKENYPTIFE
jgi:hypothetical protein